MEIKLTPKESEDIFLLALCDGLVTLEQSGVELIYGKRTYLKACEKLQSPCFEDVLMQILRDGGTLRFHDHEGNQNADITMKEVHERVPLARADFLQKMINEEYDAIDADAILQTVAYKEVIFG